MTTRNPWHGLSPYEKNPWLGLASYEEPKNDGSDYEFCGRDEETLEMVRLIDNNLFITLYGSSGIGKTSLLRAGIIPILRRKDYFPLYVRFSQEQKEISYAEAIIQKITNSGLVIEKSANVNHPDSNNRFLLWEFFATTRFLHEGREVYPVIILDQFEEVFREGNKAKAEVLLKQIYLLLNDELEMPAEAGWSSDTNYRFVASIREDFLFVLEDSIDENSLDLYKNNRYRLRPMKPEQARQVVLMPGKDCIEESEKEAVTKRIIELSNRPQGNDIDTLMLSLVCAGTYEKKSGEKIILSDLAIWKNNPMEVYYQDAVKRLSASQIRYIQQNLIREDGSRRQVDAHEVESVFGKDTYLQLTQDSNRLFAIGDKEQVELLHDQLGMAVYEERKAFEERERKKKQRRLITMICFIVLAIAGFFFFQNYRLEKTHWKMKENQARFIAKVAIDLASVDAPYTAQRLLLEVMPEDLNNPQLPYTPETEYALRTSSYREKAILADSIIFCKSLEISRDGSKLLSVFDNSINIWDTYSGELVNSLRIENDILNASFSPDGKEIASTSHNSIDIWEAESLMPVDSIDVSAKAVLFGNNNKEIIVVNYNCEDFYSYNTPVKFEFSTWDLLTKEERTRIEVVIPYYYFSFNHGFSYSYLNENEISMGIEPLRSFIVNIKTGNYHFDYKDSSSWPFFFDGNNHFYHRSIISYSINKDKCAIYDGENDNIVLFTLLHKILYKPIKEVNTVEISADGKYVLCSSNDTVVDVLGVVWTAEKDRIKCSLLKGSTPSKYEACSNDGFWAMSLSRSEKAGYSDQDTLRILRSSIEYFKYKIEDFCCGAFNPDGKSFSICTIGALTIYDSESGDSINSFPIHSITNSNGSTSWSVSSVNYHPDGEKIVTSSFDNAAIWDVNTGKCVHVLKGHSGSINSAVFSPNGNYVITTSHDKTIKIWSTDTGKLIASINGHTVAEHASFSPDEKHIIAVYSDGTICLWSFPPLQELINKTHMRFKNCPLTPAERQKYYLE